MSQQRSVAGDHPKLTDPSGRYVLMQQPSGSCAFQLLNHPIPLTLK
jgi:hypothetical protein